MKAWHRKVGKKGHERGKFLGLLAEKYPNCKSPILSNHLTMKKQLNI